MNLYMYRCTIRNKKKILRHIQYLDCIVRPVAKPRNSTSVSSNWKWTIFEAEVTTVLYVEIERWTELSKSTIIFSNSHQATVKPISST